MTKKDDDMFSLDDYGPASLAILKDLEPPVKRPKDFITGRAILDALPEAERLAAERFLDDIREANRQPRGPAETAAIEAARVFNEERPTNVSPLPPPKGMPTRSADRPPTAPKPKR